MYQKNSKIHIFTGHYGSGKTTVALNEALKMAQRGERVTVVDLDTVNPYFRMADAQKLVEQKGITVLTPGFAGSNVDIPNLPSEFMRVFDQDCGHVFIDVGGDDDGAYALGVYHGRFVQKPYDMLYVVNLRRPLTTDSKQLLEMAENIMSASRLKFSAIVNNTNIGPWTTPDVIWESREEVQALAGKLGLSVYEPDIQTILPMPWENEMGEQPLV